MDKENVMSNTGSTESTQTQQKEGIAWKLQDDEISFRATSSKVKFGKSRKRRSSAEKNEPKTKAAAIKPAAAITSADPKRSQSSSNKPPAIDIVERIVQTKSILEKVEKELVLLAEELTKLR